jgi:hypothetical protein
LCVHHQEPLKIGAFCIFGIGLIRQLPAHLARQQRAGENPGTLFRKVFSFCTLCAWVTAASRSQLLAWASHFHFNFVFERSLVPGEGANSDAAIHLAAPRSVTRDGRYEVPVQARWSFGAIEQHGDAGGTGTDVDNDASLASQLWASIDSKLAHLEASADNNSVGFLNHHQNFSISENNRLRLKPK